MARLPRLVLPGVPHHVTQRGTRRMGVFPSATDVDLYRRLLREASARHGVSIWAYCLMPNHVHLILVPESAASLAAALGQAHQRYAWRLHRREEWTGHLWQQRFYSCPLDEVHLLRAVRYVLLNPVRARLVARAEEWRGSSACSHLTGVDDDLVDPAPLAARIEDWTALLRETPSAEELESVRRRTRRGRPLPDPDPAQN